MQSATIIHNRPHARPHAKLLELKALELELEPLLDGCLNCYLNQPNPPFCRVPTHCKGLYRDQVGSL